MHSATPASLTPLERARYARHIALEGFGAAGQSRLRAASVLIVGAGGLGSPAALYLAAAGVGRIGIVDYDQVDLSNLQRQVLFATADIGTGKAASARRRLLELNPALEVEAYSLRLDAGNAGALFARYDLILDGSDRLATRYLVNDACVLLRKPLVVAAIHRFEGQALTYLPGAGPCYRCLFAHSAEQLVPNCAEAGVLGVLPGVMGSVQATEAIKVIAAIGTPLVGRLLIYDALQMRFQEFAFTRRSDCAVCGDTPTITRLTDNQQENVTVSADDRLLRLRPQQLQARLTAGSDDPPLLLVDVREPHEFEAGHLPGSLHIPLGQLAPRFAELPADRLPVFICAAGGRSLAAAQYALRQGRNAVNLEGGLHAWSTEVGELA
jgi:molybdopterin/thiamine biosynthesis adenylyltransferase/rhodanese-related sulfurtransferase